MFDKFVNGFYRTCSQLAGLEAELFNPFFLIEAEKMEGEAYPSNKNLHRELPLWGSLL